MNSSEDSGSSADKATVSTSTTVDPEGHRLVTIASPLASGRFQEGDGSQPHVVTLSDGHNNIINNHNEESALLRQRAPFLSKHRQQLDRLAADAAHSRAIPIPEQQRKKDRPPSKDKWDRIQTTITNCTQLPKTPSDWLTFFLPAWRWLKQYNVKTTLQKDLVAGLTVGVMIIPQSMSYAKLAGLPVEYGLYSSLVPIYMYALFGSSRQLAVGPVALVSLLVSTGLTNIMTKRGLTDTEDPDYIAQYVTLAIQTSFLVGVVNIFLGLARLGFITIFLSHAVISGFISGAAIIIAASQLKYIFGVSVERSDLIYEILYRLFAVIGETNWKVFVMGSLSIILLLSVKYFGKTYPKFKWVQALGPLIVTVLGIVLVAALNLDEKGIDVVGSIPKGLPSFTADLWFPMANVGEIVLPVISITLIGFMESFAIAKKMAATHKYEIDSNLELIGLGVSNLAGGMFQAYPVTGSFSRSAVNNDSGARSGISGVITATLVMLVLLFLTSIFEILPTAILGAIVIAGVVSLVDYAEAIKLWKVHKKDFVCWLCAFLGTMFLGVEIGLLMSVVISLLFVLYESAYPHTAVLGRLPGTTVYRNVKQYSDAEEYDGLVVIRIDAPLYFANAQNVREKIRKYRLAAEDDVAYRNGDVKYLILDLTPVSHVDTSALHVLEDMHDNYQSRDQQLVFCNPSLGVMKRFDDSGFADKVGRRFFFSCAHDAVKYCLGEMDAEAISTHESQGGRHDDESIDSDEDVENPKTPANPSIREVKFDKAAITLYGMAKVEDQCL